MTKEQDWLDYWKTWYPNELNVLGNAHRDEILNAFEAGYESARAEAGEAGRIIEQASKYYKLPNVPCTKNDQCLFRDGHKGDCGFLGFQGDANIG